MDHNYLTKFVRKLTGATENQLKYWVKIGIVTPIRIGKTHYYSFRDIVKLRILVQLRWNGLSLQKVRKGIENLSRILPSTEDPTTRLMIHTDGIDMIIVEKGQKKFGKPLKFEFRRNPRCLYPTFTCQNFHLRR